MPTSILPTRRIALVIGNSRYEPHAANLLNPGNDARAIASSLGRLGFSGVKPEGEDFEVDFGAVGVTAIEDVGYQALCRALAAFGRAADDAQQVVLYYAGHGIEFRQDNYLIPVGARLSHARNVDFEAASLTRVLGAIDGATGLRLVILDACRNNPFRSRLFGERSADDARGLRSIEPPGNVLVAYAARHGTVAQDGQGRKNSPFAEALLENIEVPDLEVHNLFRRVTAKVSAATGGKQQPWTYGSLGVESHFLVPQTPIKSAIEVVGERPRWLDQRKVRALPKRRLNAPFQDAEFTPWLVRIPGDQFLMGSLPSSDPGSRPDEIPAHPVTIQTFAAAVYPVTIGDWEQARKRGFSGTVRKGGRDVPVTSVSWHEAQAYVTWLSEQTKKQYRLLSEAEWEYACRAHSLDPYSMGLEINPFEAWFSAKYVGKRATDEIPPLRPIRVGVHSPNKFGLCDMHGNVHEWVEDDYHFSYKGAPNDGSPWVDRPCTTHKVLRGGCYASGPRQLRSARRARCYVIPNEPEKVGFRVARNL